MTTMFGWVTYEIIVPRTDPDRCERCSGTGRFVRGSMNDEHGRMMPAGPGGECFRCGGKGKLTPKDVKRNQYYDTHNIPTGDRF